MFYEINKSGQIVGQFNSMPRLGKNHIIIEAEAPSEMLHPRWDGKKWIDIATEEEKKHVIDIETNASIKVWCTANRKNEEYYINRGIIFGNNDSEYQEYRKQVEKLKDIGKKKKENLV